MIQQRIRIFVGDSTPGPLSQRPKVWCASNEPPHLLMHMVPVLQNKNNNTKIETSICLNFFTNCKLNKTMIPDHDTDPVHPEFWIRIRPKRTRSLTFKWKQKQLNHSLLQLGCHDLGSGTVSYKNIKHSPVVKPGLKKPGSGTKWTGYGI